MARTRILSIDGGGIRGIIPAMVLADLERRSGRAVAELFDLVAGTSTGGILALALTRPGPDGRPAYRARELVALYESEGPRIFSSPIGHRLRSGFGLIDEKYPSAGLDRALERYLGEARLSDALCDVLVTAYELERRFPFFFKSVRARGDPDYDFPMRLVARATASAPTYFEPLRLEPSTGGEAYALVDGGVFATNPAMCALAEHLRASPGAEVTMLSLGTGQLTRRIAYDDAKDWGLVEWARPVIDVVFDGVADTVDYQLDQLLGADGYVRLQTELTSARDDLDDASPGNLADLRRTAEGLIADSSSRLDELSERLAPP